MPPSPTILRVASAILAGCIRIGAARANKVVQGISWPSEQWGHPNATYDSSWANESLAAIASVGTTHLRIVVTAYVSWTGSPVVFTHDASESPLRTATQQELRSAIEAAHARGLSVMLAPILDLDWDNSSNVRLWWQAGSVSRADIGQGFSTDEWKVFFASFAAWITPLAQLAADTGVSTFSVGDELSTAFRQVRGGRGAIPIRTC